LTSALDGGARWIGGRVCPRAGLDAEKRKVSCPCRESNRSPVACRWEDNIELLAADVVPPLCCDHQLSVLGRDQVSPSKKGSCESADAARTAAAVPYTGLQAAIIARTGQDNILTCLPKGRTVEIRRRPLLGKGFVNTFPLEPNHVTEARNDCAAEGQQQFN
jgi:hypothetical protein